MKSRGFVSLPAGRIFQLDVPEKTQPNVCMYHSLQAAAESAPPRQEKQDKRLVGPCAYPPQHTYDGSSLKAAEPLLLSHSPQPSVTGWLHYVS